MTYHIEQIPKQVFSNAPVSGVLGHGLEIHRIGHVSLKETLAID